MILWIIVLEVLSVPIIAFLFSWITNIWYSKKTEYALDILKRICNVFETAINEYIKSKENKKDVNNDHN